MLALFSRSSSPDDPILAVLVTLDRQFVRRVVVAADVLQGPPVRGHTAHTLK